MWELCKENHNNHKNVNKSHKVGVNNIKSQSKNVNNITKFDFSVDSYNKYVNNNNNASNMKNVGNNNKNIGILSIGNVNNKFNKMGQPLDDYVTVNYKNNYNCRNNFFNNITESSSSVDCNNKHVNNNVNNMKNIGNSNNNNFTSNFSVGNVNNNNNTVNNFNKMAKFDDCITVNNKNNYNYSNYFFYNNNIQPVIISNRITQKMKSILHNIKLIMKYDWWNVNHFKLLLKNNELQLSITLLLNGICSSLFNKTANKNINKFNSCCILKLVIKSNGIKAALSEEFEIVSDRCDKQFINENLSNLETNIRFN